MKRQTVVIIGIEKNTIRYICRKELCVRNSRYVIRGTLLATRQTECGVIVLLFIAPSLYQNKMMRVYKVRLYDKVTAVTHSR